MIQIHCISKLTNQRRSWQRWLISGRNRLQRSKCSLLAVFFKADKLSNLVWLFDHQWIGQYRRHWIYQQNFPVFRKLPCFPLISVPISVALFSTNCVNWILNKQVYLCWKCENLRKYFFSLIFGHPIFFSLVGCSTIVVFKVSSSAAKEKDCSIKVLQ